jgi:hypothetical protein
MAKGFPVHDLTANNMIVEIDSRYKLCSHCEVFTIDNNCSLLRNIMFTATICALRNDRPPPPQGTG